MKTLLRYLAAALLPLLLATPAAAQAPVLDPESARLLAAHYSPPGNIDGRPVLKRLWPAAAVGG